MAGAAATMEKTVELAVALVDHAEEAGISLVYRDRHIDTPAATGHLPRRVDELQYEFGMGPCLDAIHDEDVVHAPDVAAHERWGQWGARVEAETSIRSMMCFRLFTHHDTVGALNLYARASNAFDREDFDTGLALAAHAAVAVAAAQSSSSSRSRATTAP